MKGRVEARKRKGFSRFLLLDRVTGHCRVLAIFEVLSVLSIIKRMDKRTLMNGCCILLGLALSLSFKTYGKMPLNVSPNQSSDAACAQDHLPTCRGWDAKSLEKQDMWSTPPSPQTSSDVDITGFEPAIV